jgi:phosphatidylglycerol---prolipoprotein diacylglyceryl transferase
VRRHPTQIYEIVFLLAMIPVLYWILRVAARPDANEFGQRRKLHAGDAFKFFMVSYMMLRLLCDFIKPYPRVFLGLGSIPWVCLLCLLYYSRDILRWAGVPGRAALSAHSSWSRQV